MKQKHIYQEDAMSAMGSMLEFLLLLEKKKINSMKAEIDGSPEGCLSIITENNRAYFRQVIKGKRTGITRDLELVYKLARKRYLQLRLKEQEKQVERVGVLTGCSRKKAAQKMRRSFSKIEQLLDKYGRAGLDILKITCTQKQYQWMKREYRKNTKNPEQLVFETYSGTKVRSKSERDIGNALEVRGIPYRYEPEVSLDLSWMEGVDWLAQGRYKTYYPDFVILTADGSLIFWEHLGRVDQEGYRKHNMEKIAAYRQNGICDDDHLILSFEKDMERPETIVSIITKRILPYV